MREMRARGKSLATRLGFEYNDTKHFVPELSAANELGKASTSLFDYFCVFPGVKTCQTHE